MSKYIVYKTYNISLFKLICQQYATVNNVKLELNGADFSSEF